VASTVTDKLPPHNIEAEEAVLGSIFVDPGCLEDILPILKPRDLYREKNQWVYEACIAVQGGINQITVSQQLMQDGKLEMVGGAGYLSLLVERLPTSLHAEHYAGIVARLAYNRRLIGMAGQIAAIGYEAELDQEETQTKIAKLLEGMAPRISTDIYTPEDQALLILKMLSEDKPLEMVKFGYPNLDNVMGGMAGGDLVVLAARTKVGKSQVSLEIALENAFKGRCVLYASAEMSIYQLLQRRVAMGAHIPVMKQRQGGLDAKEWERVQVVVDRVNTMPMFIMCGHITPQNVMQWAKRLKNSHDLKLLVFDYVQIVSRRLGQDYGQDMRNKVAYMTAFLKEVAVTLDIPVICVSQISRQSEMREGHRPTLADLKESGTLEEDADIILLLHRPELYIAPNEREASGKAGLLEVRIAGHRQLGLDDKLDLYWQPDKFQYGNVRPDAGDGSALPRFERQGGGNDDRE
jgi:replicative DNA helicase